MHSPNNILITGGSGFIGTNFIRFLLNLPTLPACIVNVDKLTYASNAHGLEDIVSAHLGKKYFFIQEDICNQSAMELLVEKYHIDTIVHFAAESHVDRSISAPKVFVDSNVIGTYSLLEAAKKCWQKSDKNKRFHHISTDEVFGSLGPTGFFHEKSPYAPRSPYSATKAASDHLVRAYQNTYGLPITMSHCSNNYGPYQHVEKMIPCIINAALTGKDLPIYGDGSNIRDWLYVEDHCSAIWAILTCSAEGESYNIGGGTSLTNLQLVHQICDTLAISLKTSSSLFTSRIKFVTDRPGHDYRYATESQKLLTLLNWRPLHNFSTGLTKTISWYLNIVQAS